MSNYEPKQIREIPNHTPLVASYCQPNRHDEKMYRGVTYGYNFDFVNERKQNAFTKPIANQLRSNYNSREDNRIGGVKLRG
jgi:hypothetical protein